MLPVHRLIGHKEYAKGRKSDPRYSMDWRRRRVAAFRPRNTTAPTPAPALEDDDMRLIQSKNRGTAVVGPGFFNDLSEDERPVAEVLFGKPWVCNDRQFDLAKAVALHGVTVSSTAAQLNAAVAKLSGLPAADVDEQVLAALLAPKLAGVTSAQIADALQQVLREGVGAEPTA